MKVGTLGIIVIFALAANFALAACPDESMGAARTYSGTINISGTLAPGNLNVSIQDQYGMQVGLGTVVYTTENGTYEIDLNYEVDCIDNNDDTAVVAGDTVYFYVQSAMVYNTTAPTSLGTPTSESVNITYADSTAPGTPASLSAVETDVANQSIVSISWTGTTDNIYKNLTYRLYRSSSTGVSSSDTLINTTYNNETNTITVNSTVPADGTTYYYTVYASDLAGNTGSAATEASVTVTNLVPAQVTGLSASSSNHTVNLTWNAVTTHNNGTSIGADLVGYHVYSNLSGTWTRVATTATTRYDNASVTNNQEYQYKVAAYDTDGNEGTNSTVVTVTPSARPSISVTPSSGSSVQSTGTINITFSSGTNMDTITYIIYNSTSGHIANNTNTSVGVTAWNYSISPALWLENDWHSIIVTANDTNGQNNSATYAFKVDDTRPTVTNAKTNDTDNVTTLTASLNLSVSVSDASTLTSVTAGVTGTEVTLTNVTANVYNVTTTATALGCAAEGNCTIIFVATDGAGNINNTANYTMVIDSTAPSVSGAVTYGGLINTSDAVFRENDTIIVNITVGDTNSISTVTVNNQSMTGSGTYNYTGSVLTLCGATDGSCTLTFVATDVAGNQNSSTTTAITVDDTSPSILRVNMSDNYVQNNTVVAVTVNITDTHSSVYNVSVEGYALTSLGSGIWSGNVNITSDNTVLDVLALDVAGNNVTDNSTTYTVDDAPPQIVTVALSDYNVRTGTIVTITVNVTDNALYNITANNQLLTLSSGTIYTGSLNLTTGTFVTIHAFDNASNNMTNVSLVYALDDTNPSVNSISIADAYVKPSQIVEVTVNVTDANVSTVTASVGSAVTLSKQSAQIWAGNLTMPSTSSNVTVVATDEAGNTNTTVGANFIVDSTAPSFSGLSPSSGEVVSNAGGNVTVNLTVTEANMTRVNVSIDYGTYVNGSTVNGTHVWTFQNLQPGTHTITFSAFDYADNNVTTTYTFKLVRPLNVTKYIADLETNLGGSRVVRRVNVSTTSGDISSNQSADVNTTLSMNLELNATGTNVSASIPSFSGLNANWEQKFFAEANESSTKGVRVRDRSGSNIVKLLLFENVTKFIPESEFTYATIVFYTALMPDQQVFFVDDDAGERVYKLSRCSSIPTSVTSATDACYLNYTSNVTLYIPHFSGGALANDTTAPTINVTAPVNDTTVTNSRVDINFSVYEANPHTTTFCNYTFGSTWSNTDIDTGDMTNNPTGSTRYDYTATLQNVSDGTYALNITCKDLNNRTTTLLYTVPVADATNPVIENTTPTSNVESTSTSVNVVLSATTNEYALCRYSTSNVSYGAMTTNLSTTYGLSHSVTLSYTADTTVAYYIACRDTVGRNATNAYVSYSVDVAASSSDDSSSSSSSGGASLTLRPYKAKQIKYDALIDAGERVNFAFSNSKIAVQQVDVVTNTAAKGVKIVAASYDEMPYTVTDIGRQVYQYVELNQTNLPRDMIDRLSVTFEVENAWMESQNIAAEDIVLSLWDIIEWVDKPTEVLDVGEETTTFRATLEHFSMYAITVGQPADASPENATTSDEESETDDTSTDEDAPAQESVTEQDTSASYVWKILVSLVILLAVIGVGYGIVKTAARKK